MTSSYGACKFWTGRKGYCGKDGIFREEYSQYYCADHYDWHLKQRARFEDMAKEVKKRVESKRKK